MKITLPALLGIVFVVLKLTHVIAWSWWWVTLPFWLGLALAALALGLQGLAWLLMSPEQRARERLLRQLDNMAQRFGR